MAPELDDDAGLQAAIQLSLQTGAPGDNDQLDGDDESLSFNGSFLDDGDDDDATIAPTSAPSTVERYPTAASASPAAPSTVEREIGGPMSQRLTIESPHRRAARVLFPTRESTTSVTPSRPLAASSSAALATAKAVSVTSAAHPQEKLPNAKTASVDELTPTKAIPTDVELVHRVQVAPSPAREDPEAGPTMKQMSNSSVTHDKADTAVMDTTSDEVSSPLVLAEPESKPASDMAVDSQVEQSQSLLIKAATEPIAELVDTQPALVDIKLPQALRTKPEAGPIIDKETQKSLLTEPSAIDQSAAIAPTFARPDVKPLRIEPRKHRFDCQSCAACRMTRFHSPG